MKSLPLYHKPRKKRVGPEAQLQMAVIQYLKLAGVPGLLYFSVANEQKCSVQRGAMLKKMGKLAGVADLVIIAPVHPGLTNTLFLEIKAAGEKQSPAQIAFADAVRRIPDHFHYRCVDNIGDAINILTLCGAIKPVSRHSSPIARAA
jgi:hypothetical protein